jgi:hypothetical protein
MSSLTVTCSEAAARARDLLARCALPAPTAAAAAPAPTPMPQRQRRASAAAATVLAAGAALTPDAVAARLRIVALLGLVLQASCSAGTECLSGAEHALGALAAVAGHTDVAEELRALLRAADAPLAGLLARGAQAAGSQEGPQTSNSAPGQVRVF